MLSFAFVPVFLAYEQTPPRYANDRIDKQRLHIYYYYTYIIIKLEKHFNIIM